MLPLPRVGGALLAHSLNCIQLGRVCQSNSLLAGTALRMNSAATSTWRKGISHKLCSEEYPRPKEPSRRMIESGTVPDLMEWDITPAVRARRRCGGVAWAGWLLASLLFLPATIAGHLLAIFVVLTLFVASYALTRGSRLAAVVHAFAVDGTLAWLTLDYMRPTFGWAVLALACAITWFGIAAAFEYHRLVPSIPSALKPGHPMAGVRAFVRSRRVLRPIGYLLLGTTCSLPMTGPAIAFLSGVDILDLFERWNPPLWAAVVYAFLVGPCCAVAYRFLTKAKQLCGLRIAELRALDSRRPVLLLRSFQDDLTPLAARLPLTTWQPSDFYRFSWTLEEALTRFLRRYGPVIAIGRPGEAVPPAGAAREYVANEAWRARIKEYIAESALVVVILGKTEGLAFEYRALAEMERHGSIVLVCPPVEASDRRQRWSSCGTTFRGPAFRSIPAAEKALAGMILESGGLRLVLCRWQDADSYRMALEHLLTHSWHVNRAPPPRRSPTPHPRR